MATIGVIDLLAGGFSLLLPILLPGLLFIVALRRNWLSALNRPIDAGIRIAGKPVFGPSKNWRGVVFYVLGAPIVVLALHLVAQMGVPVAPVFSSEPLSLGLAWGAAYVAGELINSFVKRRLGIAASSVAPTRIGARFQAFFDNTDGSLATGLLLILACHVSWSYLAVAFVLGLAAHFATDAWMRKLRLKK